MHEQVLSAVSESGMALQPWQMTYSRPGLNVQNSVASFVTVCLSRRKKKKLVDGLPFATFRDGPFGGQFNYH